MTSGAISHSFRRFLQTSPIRAATVRGPSGHSGVRDGGYKIWKYLSFCVGLPAIIGCAANCYLMKAEESDERPPFVKYDYLRLRSKRFPWGDGSRSLFHNPHTNPLPDGYEDEPDDKEKKAE